MCTLDVRVQFTMSISRPGKETLSKYKFLELIEEIFEFAGEKYDVDQIKKALTSVWGRSSSDQAKLIVA